MILEVPITGEVSSIDNERISGNPDNPIRLIDIDLGNVSWRLLSLDLNRAVATIDVTSSSRIYDAQLEETRAATAQEKNATLDNARRIIEEHSIDELYEISKSPRLIKPKKV